MNKENPVSFVIKVNEEEIYKFYVINDDGNKITLITNENLGDNVKWYAETADSHNSTYAYDIYYKGMFNHGITCHANYGIRPVIGPSK